MVVVLKLRGCGATICVRLSASAEAVRKSMDENRLVIAEYVERMAFLLDLQLNPEHRLGVVENFARIEASAQLVNEFPLPDNIEAAPIFEP